MLRWNLWHCMQGAVMCLSRCVCCGLPVPHRCVSRVHASCVSVVCCACACASQAVVFTDDSMMGRPLVAKVPRYIVKYTDFFTDMCQQEYQFYCYPPSLLAAAIVLAARRALNIRSAPACWTSLMRDARCLPPLTLPLLRCCCIYGVRSCAATMLLRGNKGSQVMRCCCCSVSAVASFPSLLPLPLHCSAQPCHSIV